jgi:hypothetical protein
MASLPWAAGSGDLSLVKDVLAQGSFTGEEKNIPGDRALERSGSGEVFDFLIGRFKHREINPKLPGAARKRRRQGRRQREWPTPG